MAEEYYYIAYHQAVVAKNLSKVVELSLFNGAEETAYPNEYPDLTYDQIFQDNDPDEEIKDLLKREEYKEFYKNYLSQISILAGNYYIALYQAIIEKNASKAKMLFKLNCEEKLSYPNEYPNLNYTNIYNDIHPRDISTELLRNKEDLEFVDSLLERIYNPLATEENISKREENFLELMKNPLIDYCPNLDYALATIDSIDSITYSAIFTKEKFNYELYAIFKKSPILAEILSIIAISINIKSDTQFSIALIGDNIQEYDPTLEETFAGYHYSIRNTVVVTNKSQELNKPFLMHELAHKTMQLLFENSMNPYYKTSENKIKYQKAIKYTLLNIKEFIKQDFGLDLFDIKPTDSNWQIGTKLSTILYPYHLNKNNIKDFIFSLKRYDLDINKEFTWLNGYSPLWAMLIRLEFELADQLVNNKAVISPYLLSDAAYLDNMELLNWALYNDQAVNINFKDEYGYIALDYTTDPQIIEKLISAGASVYPGNYENICSVNLGYKEMIETPISVAKELNALENFLMLYLQYDRDDEHAEFIVRLPQTIADNLYEGKIVDIFKPIVDYWEEVVSPSIVEYINIHDKSGVCLPLIDYNY